ncbi:Ham1-like protein [Sulfurimonas denitrificans DSM 1251]|uniref:dITP/XTP pyrophosphatase n=1 Tax=Sulfurimonas denitrificans (strain ATCC 33889 / DSM 1251) TaxID=326298 RepID=IXTPA_SULDN|nr:RdgB/HAM1 family non-canonical purine NTP pyrophosphatase [Sulfurimonas denitrificans]Q30UH9.1 RecName: Full=dITP/XTP pyrophosphatase; AltName: Full=Non-canonical purine NTP pyrophosphatase; AltName: Full=Non-standard purine NTP pyrophosphatase; AltName: Full=Nucleoside-triphosphate diphosphatase; AltName: Full=Nucleoside-triphosphate pyrophosphatase; Short=NTPase [Sulfurimonas denitrificans DSM 1251]ABB43352.1 Ham1-like protein [Sulfurimonas denitrificans DSM 1251]
MRLILATSNRGKVKEIKALCKDFKVIPYSELIEEFEIIEDASTFKGNALIKARAVFKVLSQKDEYKDMVVLADDSGISVDVLGGAPGIYSARYASKGASDKENLYKLIEDVKKSGAKGSPAHYTAAIAIVTKNYEYSVHGWMYGDVIAEVRGDGGFGYDPMFIPLGYDKTLGELDDDTKKNISHRAKALSLAKIILQTL